MQSLELICRPPYFPLIFAIIHIYRRGFIEIWYEIPRRFVDSLCVDYLGCKEHVTGKDLVTETYACHFEEVSRWKFCGISKMSNA